VEAYRKDSDCRKPRPGMFVAAARDLDIDVSRSVMIGDKQSDRIELTELKSYVVKSRYSGPGFDFETLEQAASVL
jgi:histidinol phosphatase-like enzyme